jgi:hypothetical protein
MVILDALLNDLQESLFRPFGLQPQQEVEEVVKRLMLRNGQLGQSKSAKIFEEDVKNIFFSQNKNQVAVWKVKNILINLQRR